MSDSTRGSGAGSPRTARPRSGPLAAALAAFARRRDGNVAMLFALLSLPLLGFTGAAIDYGFATRLETKLQAAVDATVLTLCQTPQSTLAAALQLQAEAAVKGYMGTTPSPTIDPIAITQNPRQITLTARMASPAFFGKITGVTTLTPKATARCATPMPKIFEIALVLDNTGSMETASAGQTKMQALKTAASNFIDYVYTNQSFATGTRVSIVPFAGAVAVDPGTYRYAAWIDQLGQSRYHWTNVTGATAAGFTSRFSIFSKLQSAYSGWGWAGCLETLPYPLNVQDGAPTGADSLYVPLFAPDEPGSGAAYGFWWNSSYVVYNSYIDDSTAAAGCGNQSLGFAAAESRACKYNSPRGVSPRAASGLSTANGPNTGCTTQPLQRLTTSTTTLKSAISNMISLGSTNIHEGLMWGWRTLSPNSVFADGAAYSSITTNKILILMSDGENSWPLISNYPSWNQSQYFAAGYLKNADGTTANPRLPPSNQSPNDVQSTRNALDALTAEACANLKATGISVYTIGFSIPTDPIDAQGLSLLGGCASNPAQAFVATDSNALIAAFDQIAASIGKLRLTQ